MSVENESNRQYKTYKIINAEELSIDDVLYDQSKGEHFRVVSITTSAQVILNRNTPIETKMLFPPAMLILSIVPQNALESYNHSMADFMYVHIFDPMIVLLEE